jgi:Protein of unknown function (DUF1360)
MGSAGTVSPLRRPVVQQSAAPERPLGGYALLTGVFMSAAAAFSRWLSRSGRELPERVDAADVALLSVATHKAARLIAKDRVTAAVRAPFTDFQGEGGPSEVEERARGSGVRRAVGELLVCPYCLGLWIAAAFTAGLIVAPRQTRWLASVLVMLTGSDALQIAYVKLERTL